MFLTIEVSKNKERYQAYCVELDITASGTTSEKAISKLKKVIDFYLSTAKDAEKFDNLPQAEPEQISSSLFN